MTELTKRQRQVLDFIQSMRRSTESAPTLREIAVHFGFKSSRAAADHVAALKRKGFLESDSGKARSLRVISPLAKLRSRIMDIPLFGSIPAGPPQSRDQEDQTAACFPGKRSNAESRSRNSDSIPKRYPIELKTDAQRGSSYLRTCGRGGVAKLVGYGCEVKRAGTNASFLARVPAAG
jgi:hypothetical protein